MEQNTVAPDLKTVVLSPKELRAEEKRRAIQEFEESITEVTSSDVSFKEKADKLEELFRKRTTTLYYADQYKSIRILNQRHIDILYELESDKRNEEIVSSPAMLFSGKSGDYIKYYRAKFNEAARTAVEEGRFEFSLRLPHSEVMLSGLSEILLKEIVNNGYTIVYRVKGSSTNLGYEDVHFRFMSKLPEGERSVLDSEDGEGQENED